MSLSGLLPKKNRALATLLSTVVLGAALPAMASQAPPSDSDGDYENGSHLVDEPTFLLPGSLDISITAPDFSDEFSAETTIFDAYPGTLFMEDTPYGGIVVFDTGNLAAPEYLLGFIDLGVSLPLTAVDGHFAGSFAGFDFEVASTAIVQDPQGPSITGGGRVRGVPGWNSIRITEPCPGARFRQFVSITVTWNGVSRGPLPPQPRSGTSSGTIRPTGNNGQPVDLSGATTYVDSNNSVTGANTPAGYDQTNDGDYPATTNGGSTSMEDAPNLLDPSGIVRDIENGDPGTRVTEITITMNFTTYVIKNGAITSKIQWTAVETIAIPSAVPHFPGCGFGGPDAGPGQPPFTAGGIPRVTPVNAMDPQHAAAHGGYLGGNFGGAPSQGGY